ncbi:transglutaminase domain-containing protein [Bacillus sp. Marseille-P3661]|uniref:transglutaminase domain-containing protein n=1 Tax=Bacillus sp. Marseille-P3661 TaxID=1936234 RepID=UPI000C83F6CB|nr:transglutaminase domain-containing protein [Bacillus sp. Marseille-P3661]
MSALRIWFIYPVIIMCLFFSTAPIHTISAPLYDADTTTPSTHKASSLKDIENIVSSSMKNRKTNIMIKYKGSTNNLLNKISSYIDHTVKNDEYLNYSFRGFNMSYKAYGSNITITIVLRYYETLAQMIYVDQYVTTIMKEITKPTMNDHEKVKAVHDFVVKNLSYDTSLINNSPYPAIIEGTTACNGYAMLIYKMLQHAGIDVRLISGVASSRSFAVQNHAWNMVKLEGRWYHLDATWNDPVPDEKGRVLYHYYLLSDQEISKDHSWTTGGINGEEMPYPIAKTTYFEELQTKINTTNEADRFTALLNELELQYLLPEFTATTIQELINLIEKGFNNYNEEFSIRYVDLKGIHMSDLRKMIYESAIKLGVNAWSYGFVSYTKGLTDNDKLITISNIVYQQVPEQKQDDKTSINYPTPGYESIGTFANVAKDKQWTIQFDSPIDFSSVTTENIMIYSSDGNKLSTIDYSLKDSNSLSISNKEDYKTGETYYLYVKNTIKGTNGKKIKDSVSIKFTIQKNI